MYKYILITTSLISSGSAVPLTDNITDSMRRFACNLYDVLPVENNTIFSPLSLYAALSALYLGSVGDTTGILRETLHLLDKYNQTVQYRHATEQLKNNGKNVTVAVANMIFISKSLKANKQYGELVRYYFNGVVASADFKKRKEAAKTINKLVAEKTRGAVQNAIAPTDLSKSTKLVLVNSVSVRGHWTNAFAAGDTSKKKFRVSQNETVLCKMMYQSNYFKYFESKKPTFQVIELTLGGAPQRYSMVIVLPKLRDFETVESRLSDEEATFITLANNLTTRLVNLSLPVFNVELKLDLQSALVELGLENVFSKSAVFSKMTNAKQSMKVDKVVQKAHMEANEMGIGTDLKTDKTFLNGTTPPPPTEGPPVSFNANRPFIFYILAVLKNATVPNILFMGRLNSPTIITK